MLSISLIEALAKTQKKELALGRVREQTVESNNDLVRQKLVRQYAARSCRADPERLRLVKQAGCK
ncbi:MAG: hypothetical protein ABI334_01890 [Candidatus Dormiibacterota bacterium]